MLYDVVIIGSGPSGLAAGLYAARAGGCALLIEELYAGGQMTKSERIDNYPGFDDGIDGIALAARMEKHAIRFGLEKKQAQVTGLDMEADPKRVMLDSGEVNTKTIIIATGTRPNKLGLEGEDAFVGAGISYCATCDAAFFKGRDVAVIGGGNAAFNEAIHLSRFAGKVYLVHRRSTCRAVAALQTVVKNEPRVEMILNSAVVELFGDDRLSGIKVRNVETGGERVLDVAGMFVAIGAKPRVELVAGKLELDQGGYIVTDAHMQTSIPGVYAIGDVRNTPLRQVVTAVADGAIAATHAIENMR